MSNNNDHYHTANNPSSRGMENETNLPDHLLSENSLVKRERYNKQIFAILIKAMLHDLEMIQSIEKWKEKNKYDELMLEDSMRMNEIGDFFKMLGKMDRESHEKTMKLEAQQLLELQQRLEKINIIKSILREKIQYVAGQIATTKNEINVLNNNLIKAFSNYKKLVSDCFSDNANYEHFKPINIPSDIAARGNIYIDQDKFKMIGRNFSEALNKQGYAADKDKVMHNVIEDHIKDQILPQNAGEQEKIQALVKNIGVEFNQHMQKQAGYEAMQNEKVKCNALMTEISKKELILAMLEDEFSLLNEYDDALTKISEPIQKMTLEGKCNKDIYKVLNASCDSTIDEIYHKIDRDAPSKAAKEEVKTSMRMR